jgi:hypothetical protein
VRRKGPRMSLASARRPPSSPPSRSALRFGSRRRAPPQGACRCARRPDRRCGSCAPGTPTRRRRAGRRARPVAGQGDDPVAQSVGPSTLSVFTPSPRGLNAMASVDSAMPYDGKSASLRKPTLRTWREGLERLGPDRLRATAGHSPRRKIDPLEVLFANALHAERVRKVRGVRDGPLVPRDRLEPAHGPLQEEERRQEHARNLLA